jgi:hypothetical protein
MGDAAGDRGPEAADGASSGFSPKGLELKEGRFD